jgi:hypothetical protein
VPYFLGKTPGAVVTAEFDGDSIPDLAAAAQYPHTLVIYVGTEGGFADGGTYQVGGGISGLYPASLAADDLNGDGLADVVVVNSDQQNYQVFLSHDGGPLVGGPLVDLSLDPLFVALGDVDRDGKLDMVVARYGVTAVGDVSVLHGNGDGTFGLPVPVATYGNVSSLVLRDFNGDGILDLAAANEADIRVFLGLPDGGFTLSGIYPGSSGSPGGVGGPDGLSAGDFDGDGVIDLAGTAWTASQVSLLLGNGDGTFRPKTFAVGTDVAGDAPIQTLFADIAGDGHDELIVAEQAGASLEIYRWDPSISGASLWFSVYTLWPQSLVAMPHPDSGVVDVATVNALTGMTLTVFVNGCP